MRMTVKRVAKFLNTYVDHVRLLSSEGKIAKIVDGKIEFQSIIDHQWTSVLAQFDRLIMHDTITDSHGF